MSQQQDNLPGEPVSSWDLKEPASSAPTWQAALHHHQGSGKLEPHPVSFPPKGIAELGESRFSFPKSIYYRRNVCILPHSPESYVEAPNQMWWLWEGIGFRWSHDGGAPMVRLVFLKEEKSMSELSFSLPCEHTVRRWLSTSWERALAKNGFF